MKHFKQTLCVLLSLLMLLPMSLVGISAETSTPDVDAVTPGTVLYADDFESYNAVNWVPSKYAGSNSGTNYATFTVERKGENTRFKSKVNTANGSQFEILPAGAMNGVKKYTINFTMEMAGSVNSSWWFYFIGLRIGSVDASSLAGDWIGFGTDASGDNLRVAQSYNSNQITKKFDRLSCFNNPMQIKIEADTVNKTIKVYVDNELAVTSTTGSSVANGIYFTAYTGTTSYVPTVYFDDISVVDTDKQEIIYEENFENTLYPEYPNTAYAAELKSYAVRAFGGTASGSNSLFVKSDSENWSLLPLVPAQATAGVSQYTVSFKTKFNYDTATGGNSWHNMLGVHLGEFNPGKATGTWVNSYYPFGSEAPNDMRWQLFSYNAANSAVGSTVTQYVGSSTGMTVDKNMIYDVEAYHHKKQVEKLEIKN